MGSDEQSEQGAPEALARTSFYLTLVGIVLYVGAVFLFVL